MGGLFTITVKRREGRSLLGQVGLVAIVSPRGQSAAISSRNPCHDIRRSKRFNISASLRPAGAVEGGPDSGDGNNDSWPSPTIESVGVSAPWMEEQEEERSRKRARRSKEDANVGVEAASDGRITGREETRSQSRAPTLV